MEKELKFIFERNENWRVKKISKQENYFTELSKDQKPNFLYIGCSDSRVPAGELMGVEAGEVFVHRNIANVVPPIDLSSTSVVEYAVEHLKIKHIVVCGHYSCGGVKAAMQSTNEGILNPWLSSVRDVFRLHKEELEEIKDEKKRYDRLVELNVEEQCINLIKKASVQKAYRKRNLKVHGWVFDIKTGKLKDLEINFERILKTIMKIYEIEE